MVGTGEFRVDFLEEEGREPGSGGPQGPLPQQCSGATRGGKKESRRGEQLAYVFPAEGTGNRTSAQPRPPSHTASSTFRQPPALSLSP